MVGDARSIEQLQATRVLFSKRSTSPIDQQLFSSRLFHSQTPKLEKPSATQNSAPLSGDGVRESGSVPLPAVRLRPSLMLRLVLRAGTLAQVRSQLSGLYSIRFPAASARPCPAPCCPPPEGSAHRLLLRSPRVPGHPPQGRFESEGAQRKLPQAPRRALPEPAPPALGASRPSPRRAPGPLGAASQGAAACPRRCSRLWKSAPRSLR